MHEKGKIVLYCNKCRKEKEHLYSELEKDKEILICDECRSSRTINDIDNLSRSKFCGPDNIPLDLLKDPRKKEEEE